MQHLGSWDEEKISLCFEEAPVDYQGHANKFPEFGILMLE